MSIRKVDLSKLDLKKIGARITFIRQTNALTMDDFAKKIGLTKGNISNFEKHKYEPTFKVLVEIYKHFGINPDWLLTGEGSPYIKGDELSAAHEMPQASNVVELRHMELVKGFKDKPRAYEINRQLKELETLDDETFKRIETYIKATVDQVRYAAERSPQYGDRRQADRRVDTDSEPLGGKDRRQGQDRRKASGGHH